MGINTVCECCALALWPRLRRRSGLWGRYDEHPERRVSRTRPSFKRGVCWRLGFYYFSFPMVLSDRGFEKMSSISGSCSTECAPAYDDLVPWSPGSEGPCSDGPSPNRRQVRRARVMPTDDPPSKAQTPLSWILRRHHSVTGPSTHHRCSCPTHHRIDRGTLSHHTTNSRCRSHFIRPSPSLGTPACVTAIPTLPTLPFRVPQPRPSLLLTIY